MPAQASARQAWVWFGDAGQKLWGGRQDTGILYCRRRMKPMEMVHDLSHCPVVFEQDTTPTVVVEMSKASWLAAGFPALIANQ